MKRDSHFINILLALIMILFVFGCRAVPVDELDADSNPFEDNGQQQTLTSRSWCGVGQMTYPYNSGEILLRTLFKVKISVEGEVRITTLSLDNHRGLRNEFQHSCQFIDPTVLRCYSHDIHFVIDGHRISTLLLTKLITGPEIQVLSSCSDEQLLLMGE